MSRFNASVFLGTFRSVPLHAWFRARHTASARASTLLGGLVRHVRRSSDARSSPPRRTSTAWIHQDPAGHSSPGIRPARCAPYRGYACCAGTSPPRSAAAASGRAPPRYSGFADAIGSTGYSDAWKNRLQKCGARGAVLALLQLRFSRALRMRRCLWVFRRPSPDRCPPRAPGEPAIRNRCASRLRTSAPAAGSASREISSARSSCLRSFRFSN